MHGARSRNHASSSKALLFFPPKPSVEGSGTILGGNSTTDLALDPAACVPVSNDNIMSWIRRASEQDMVDPYTFLSQARNEYKLDQYDDNLAAAERYFDGLQGNYNSHLMAGQGVLKSLREISIGGYKPMEKIGGRNGSKNAEFVTRWGMLGVFDRENGRTHFDRIRAYGKP
jgi:hypothetical protein